MSRVIRDFGPIGAPGARGRRRLGARPKGQSPRGLGARPKGRAYAVQGAPEASKCAGGPKLAGEGEGGGEIGVGRPVWNCLFQA